MVSKSMQDQKITVLKKDFDRCIEAERSLRSRELRFSVIFNQSFQFALILDTDGNVLEMNDLCRKVCGDYANGVVGNPIWDAGWWNRFDTIRKQTRRAFSTCLTNQIVSDEAIFIDRHDQIRQGLRIFSPIKDETGKIDLVSVVGLDISEKNKAQEALRVSEQKYHYLLNHFPAVPYQFVANPQGEFHFEYIGEKCQDIFGLAAQDILEDASKVFALIPEPDAEIIHRAIQRSMEALTPYKVDHRVRKMNGDTIWVHASSLPRKQENGNIVWDGIAVDITERKLTEENLQIYKNIVSSTLDGIAYLDMNYRYVIVNDAYETYSGISRKAFIGKTVSEYLGEEVFITSIKPRFDRCLDGETVSYQQWFDYPKLGRRYVEVTYFPYRDVHQRIVGVAAVTRDITEQKMAQEALQHSYQELKLRQDIAKSFLICSNDRVFGGLLDLLLVEFKSQYGYIGYIDDKGDLVCPSMTHDIWPECRIPDKSMVFKQACWGGIWGRSLQEKRTIVRNSDLKAPEGHVALDNALVVPLVVGGDLIGQIAVANKASDYTALDRSHMEALCDFIAPILKIYVEKERAEHELREHTRKLEENNIALNVLLDNREENKKSLVESILTDFEKRVFPYYDKLKKQHNKKDLMTIVDIVKTNTMESLSLLEKPSPQGYPNFTPTEIQVADLIKKGMASKQIGSVLNISPRAVFFHRNNIRKKLNLQNSKKNLRSFLLSNH